MNGVKSFSIKRMMKSVLPRSLFGRTLLIVVVPTILTLTMATYVFFDRYWATVTYRMATTLASDVAVIIDLTQQNNIANQRDPIIDVAVKNMEVDSVVIDPPHPLREPRHPNYNPLRNILIAAIKKKVTYPFNVRMKPKQEIVIVEVAAPHNFYTIKMPYRRIYTPTTQVFLIWMIGSSLLLSFVALLFMRNQVRPIRRLADAAEAIGRGQDVPWFKLEGASEVRIAASALMQMRDRLSRQITQRTTMLAGVSHDLRTPLTRMKLQLAMMGDAKGRDDLLADITDMEGMLDAYLAFAKGEEAEVASPVDVGDLLNEVVAAARRQNSHIKLAIDGVLQAPMRRNAMKRCLHNLIGNAIRYASKAEINVRTHNGHLEIVIDDNGTGIEASKREEVFRPFFRLEESRNRATGGVGLGLTIARDIARFHGGDIVLGDSPQGGLRVLLWIPM